MVSVAVCQLAPINSGEHNRALVGEYVADAAARGTRLIVLPEYSSYFVNPMDETLVENAENLDGDFVTALTGLAAEYGVTIVAGLIEKADAAHVHNTLVAVDGNGVIARYRKQHLYDAFGQSESDWVKAGDIVAPETFEIDGLRFGLMTCYDLRFPEVARTLADAGVDAIIIPAEWVRGPLKEHHWKTLLTARAIENTVYVIAADHPTPIGVGHSLIIDPEGVALAAVGTQEGIAHAQLDAAEVARVRTVNPALKLRRYRVLAG